MRCLRGNNVTQRTIISERLENIEGLAFNWMSRQLFFVDAVNKRIEVVRLDGTHRKVIISNDTLDSPRAIAVHPERGLVFL